MSLLHAFMLAAVVEGLVIGIAVCFGTVAKRADAEMEQIARAKGWIK